MITECLLEDTAGAELNVEVRFLQLYEQDSFDDVIERRISVENAGSLDFQFDGIRGEVHIEQRCLGERLEKIRITVINRTPHNPDKNALIGALISTHTILTAQNGHFVSLIDPPETLRNAAASCENVGTWPVLVGKPPERDCMLSSPIILYDYPYVAEESPSDLFDCTEIDEILTLRILTLSEAEKEEIQRSGGRELRLLQRAESLTPEELLRLHGTMRDIHTGLKRGDRVRLRPKPGGDIFDVVLAGRIAIVESVEQDFENRTHVAVVIEDDPGKDLGLIRQTGHRFFFSADEVELLT
jgi:hypothetical protein